MDYANNILLINQLKSGHDLEPPGKKYKDLNHRICNVVNRYEKGTPSKTDFLASVAHNIQF